MLDIKIVISGSQAEGKTTVALWLSALMRAVGFDVYVTDADIDYGTHFPDLQERRLAALGRRRQKVSITTVQTGRSPL